MIFVLELGVCLNFEPYGVQYFTNLYRVNTFRRNDLLEQFLEHYSECGVVSAENFLYFNAFFIYCNIIYVSEIEH